MRVNSPNNIGASVGAKGAKKKKGAGGFSPLEDESVASAPQTTQAAPISDIDALLALQSVDAVDAKAERKRQAVQQAQDMLDELDAFKVAFLTGRVAGVNPRKLRTMLDQAILCDDDPGLKDLLDHIRLRAEVELAKLNYK